MEAELTRLAKTAARSEACHADLVLTGTIRLRRRIAADPLPGHRGWVVWSLPLDHDHAMLGEAVRPGQRRLASFLEADALGFYSLNQDGVFQSINDNIAMWLGHEAGDIIAAGRGLGDFLADNEDGTRPEIALLCEGVRGELRLQDRDGNIIHARYAQDLAPSEDGNGFAIRSMLRRLSGAAQAEDVPLLSLR